MKNSHQKFVFIVGSPRSGTTLLGEILDSHSDISQWYEPYFVWDKHFRNAPHDERNREDATPKVCRQIFRDFFAFRKKINCHVLVDKSPRNSLKIPFIQEIFPEAYFIHILRDGRDVTLSIAKEWNRRIKIAGDSRTGGGSKFDYNSAYKVLKEWLKKQPFILDKLKALWFETHGHVFDKSRHLNRLRWNGKVGWGPRMKGWIDYLETRSIIEFNAFQWTSCVEAIKRDWPLIPEKNRIEIRYEDLLRDTETVLTKVLNKIELRQSQIFFQNLPQLKKGNYFKWKREFGSNEIELIKPILSHLISELGYGKTNEW